MPPTIHPAANLPRHLDPRHLPGASAALALWADLTQPIRMPWGDEYRPEALCVAVAEIHGRVARMERADRDAARPVAPRLTDEELTRWRFAEMDRWAAEHKARTGMAYTGD